MTTVARIVSIGFESNTPQDSNMHQRKQIPCITSLLTRKIHFKRKGMTQRRVWTSHGSTPLAQKLKEEKNHETKRPTLHPLLFHSLSHANKIFHFFLLFSAFHQLFSFLFFCLHGSLSAIVSVLIVRKSWHLIYTMIYYSTCCFILYFLLFFLCSFSLVLLPWRAIERSVLGC